MTPETKTQIAPYDFGALEEKWRPIWQAAGLYRTGDDPAKPRVYILDFFPYPSGDGLSVGHCRNYVPYLRQRPLPPHARLQRPAPDGLGRLRPAGRELCHRPRHPPGRNDAPLRRQLQAADATGRVLLRLVARDRLHRSGLLPLDAVVLSAAIPPRPGLSRPGQPVVVPRLPHHPGQRAGGGGPLLALRFGRDARRNWSSGTSRSPTTPSNCWPGWRRSTGRSASRRCSGSGSAAAKARK